jgi:hypothetical protein
MTRNDTNLEVDQIGRLNRSEGLVNARVPVGLRLSVNHSGPAVGWGAWEGRRADRIRECGRLVASDEVQSSDNAVGALIAAVGAAEGAADSAPVRLAVEDSVGPADSASLGAW